MKKNMQILAAIITLQIMTVTTSHAESTIVMGAINANGTSQIATNAFKVSHPSTGRYIITFTSSTFNNALPICMIMPLGNYARIKRIWENGNTCDFTIINGSTLNEMDAVFNFMTAPATR